MPGTGRLAHIGVGKQTAWGTPVAAAAYLRFVSEALSTTIEEVVSQQIQSVPDQGPIYQGAESHSGEIVFEAHPNVLGWFLLSALGPVTTTQVDVGVRWRHEFTKRVSDFSTESFAQPLTLEIHRDLGQAFQYADAVVNRLALSFGTAQQKVCRVTASVLARNVGRITATSPSFEATQAFRYHQAAITLPDPTAFNTLRELEVTIDNGLRPIELLDGTRLAARLLAEEARVVTVAGAMIMSSAEWDELRNASERALKVVFTGPTLGTGTYKMTIEVPRFRYSAYDLGVASHGLQFVRFTGKGRYDSAVAASPVKITLENSQGAY